MEVIKIVHPHNHTKDSWPPLSIALGFFDGVHLGHQKVIQNAKDKADEQGIKSAVMTFDPHPSAVLGDPQEQIRYITPINEKIKIVAKLGIDYLFIVHFSKAFANLDPEAFIDQYIIDLNVSHVTAGFDYTYGKFGKGTMDTMKTHAKGNFSTTTIPQLKRDNAKISSSLIRTYLKEGSVEKIPPLLGRYYTVTGPVVQGDQRGRQLGFPTANVAVSEEFITPPTGVYAVRIFVQGKWWRGVCNLGYKPTFHDDLKAPSIEVHIFDFDQDIYGEEVEVEWHQHIRDERKFNGIEALIEQIAKDKQATLDYFAKNNG
ncbi:MULTISPECIES: bifunctional riboflavin kinase/FAD synthetase [Cytobacillus]|uniref:Riboflavin biosynthesis protein n=1 Tax=Cytobacillus stercorigallinarum TaxID=2762240 RepID=A0ABR8QMD2_9BACI|nr:bifunctional riboflavin kinase/FAD synthetase [Cytobacillus stercorigallinarum]MBD7936679.1 bifunctional riboflavin kinase/FAD synthetase [Cytobacillus stercorigallinarum]